MKTKLDVPTKPIRRSLRWGSGIAVLALMPKCVLCVSGYLGVGAALGLTGPEICGVAPTVWPMWLWPVFAVALVIGPVVRRRTTRGRRQSARASSAFSDAFGCQARCGVREEPTEMPV